MARVVILNCLGQFAIKCDRFAFVSWEDYLFIFGSEGTALRLYSFCTHLDFSFPLYRFHLLLTRYFMLSANAYLEKSHVLVNL